MSPSSPLATSLEYGCGSVYKANRPIATRQGNHCVEMSRGLRLQGLQRLFEPRGIAVVGASRDLSRVGGQPIHALNRFGFRGNVFPINPKYTQIDGLRCYSSVHDIEQPCDVALIAVPAQASIEAVRACGNAGINFCVVLSAGFRETGEAGAALEAALCQAAAQSGTRLVGPNCQGLLNLHERVYAGFGSVFQEPDLTPGAVSLVTQSGGFGYGVLMSCTARGIGFRVAISTGNEADITTPEIIEALAEDPETRIICAYIEGIADGRRLLSAARRCLAVGKPLLVWKAGNSVDGARAAVSHTGSMTGSYDIYRAAFKQAGIIEILDIDDVADACRAFLGGRIPAGPRVASVGISGGAGILFADRATSRGLSLSQLGKATTEQLRASVPFFGSVSNPVDVTANVFNDATILTKVISSVLGDTQVDQLAVMLASLPGNAALRAAQAIRDATERHAKPVLVSWSGRRHRAEAAYALLEEMRIPIFESPVRTAEAAAWLVRFSASRSAPRLKSPPKIPRMNLPTGGGILNEIQSKLVLKELGIPITREKVLPPDTVDVGDLDLSFPVVVKAVCRDVAHKSELGGVQLGITSVESLATAIKTIEASVRKRQPETIIEGYIVAEMITDGLETIVGVVRDPSFGPVVAFGLGGVMTELLDDLSYRVAPFGVDEAHAMICELRSASLFRSFRGSEGFDVDALAEAIARVSTFAAQEERVKELDINPLFVLPNKKGVVAADALVITQR
jgi:acetate---CoA ligase (ADP-forming)